MSFSKDVPRCSVGCYLELESSLLTSIVPEA